MQIHLNLEELKTNDFKTFKSLLSVLTFMRASTAVFPFLPLSFKIFLVIFGHGQRPDMCFFNVNFQLLIFVCFYKLYVGKIVYWDEMKTHLLILHWIPISITPSMDRNTAMLEPFIQEGQV